MSMQKIMLWLKQTIGLDAAVLGNGTVWQSVRRRMQTHGLENEQAYWHMLQGSPHEGMALIEEVTVGESWFFRYPEAFRVMLAHLCDRHRPLRLLSIPCSTGEEPYSMAMTLLDAGVEPSEFHIDALDISWQSLEQARKGVYGQHSFRGSQRGYQQRHFEKVEGGFLIHANLRTAVCFRQGNILQHQQMRDMGRYDVIFCRNLMIYLDEEHRQRTVSLLESMLTEDGLLFVGHAETGVIWQELFRPLAAPMCFAYRRLMAGERKQPNMSGSRDERQRTLPPVFAQKIRRRSVVSSSFAGAKASDPDLNTISALANRGLMSEARQLCEAYLRQHGASVEAWFLKGLICDIQQQYNEAESAFRKVLYLQPGHDEALLHLAFLLESQGDVQAAEQVRQRAHRVHQRQLQTATSREE